MISALKSIFILISSIVSFIIGFFQDLVYMIILLGNFILSLIGILGLAGYVFFGKR